MNSNKQKKKLLRAKRKQRAENCRLKLLNQPAYGRLKADHSQLTHINTYGILPEFYEGVEFQCRDCGTQEVWSAASQKFYYEVCKGHIDARAVRCKTCRLKIRQAKKEQRTLMSEASKKNPTMNELFFRDLDKFKNIRNL